MDRSERRLNNNALRHETYLLKKINEGMLVLDNADSDDFTKIFEKVGEDKVSENFKLMCKWREPEVGPTVQRSFVLNIIGNSLI